MTTHNHTTDAQPSEHWPFRPGEAVYYEPSGAKQTIPLVPISAVILSSDGRFKASIRRADKDRPSSVHLHSLAYRGYCAVCPCPAIVGPKEKLICPNCGQPATPTPPPDELVLRWWPLDHWCTPMAIYRAVMNPRWTWDAARSDWHQHYHDTYNQMHERLRLPVLYSSSDTNRWREEGRYFKLLHLYAMLGDADSFKATYEDLRRFKYGDERPISEALSQLFTIPGDGPGRASQRLVLPDLEIVRLPDDSEPDGECELTRWLAAQFRRAA